jgi:hypothetical protein
LFFIYIVNFDNQIKDIIKRRWEKIYDPVMLVAYLLNPRISEHKLPEEGMTLLSNFIIKYYPNDSIKIWEQFLQYKARSGIFGNSLAWVSINNVDLLTWWKGNFGAVAPELTKVAVRVLSIPTSSAAAERNWSTFSYIHDKKRNKLTNDRIFKLVYIYFNNKLKTPKISKVTNVDEDIDDSDGTVDDDTVDDSDDNVDNVDNSDIDSDDENELSVNI